MGFPMGARPELELTRLMSEMTPPSRFEKETNKRAGMMNPREDAAITAAVLFV